jgi:hypothetical protein
MISLNVSLTCERGARRGLCALCRLPVRAGEGVLVLRSLHAWGDVLHAFNHLPGRCPPALRLISKAA